MSNIASKIKAHGASIERRKLSIPEWEVNCLVHPMNVEQRGKYMKLATSGDSHAALLEAIVMCCRDENGLPVFDHEDKLAMKFSADSAVVERVGLFVIKPYVEIAATGEAGTGAETGPTSPE